MNLFTKSTSSVIAAALAFGGLNVAAEGLADFPGHVANGASHAARTAYQTVVGTEQIDNTREAAKSVRDAHEDARQTTAADLPALIEVMGDPMPHADSVQSVVDPKTATSRLFVKVMTEPNIDVAITDANALVEEIFREDTSSRLLLLNTSIAKLVDAQIYDTSMRARARYVDYLIRTRLDSAQARTMLTGDTVILGIATGVALASGFRRGPTQAIEAIEGVNYKGLAKGAREGINTRAGKLAASSRSALNEAKSTSRSVAGIIAAAPGKAYRGVVRFGAPTSRSIVQHEVNTLLNGVAAHQPAVVTKEVIASMKLTKLPIPRDTGYYATKTSIDGLRVAIEEVEGNAQAGVKQARLIFEKSHPTATDKAPKFFASKLMAVTEAETLHSGLVRVVSIQGEEVIFKATGKAAASEELKEATAGLASSPAAKSDLQEKATGAIETAKDVVSEASEQLSDVTKAGANQVANAVEPGANKVTEVAEDASKVANGEAKRAKELSERSKRGWDTRRKNQKAAAVAEEVPKSKRNSRTKSTAAGTEEIAATPKKVRAQTNSSGLGKDETISSAATDASGNPSNSEKAGEAVKNAGEAVAETVGTAGEKTADVVEAAGEKVAEATEKSGNFIRRGFRKVQGFFSSASKTAGEGVKNVGERAGSLKDKGIASTKAAYGGAKESTIKAKNRVSARAEKIRAALNAEMKNFDRPAALRDGILVGSSGVTAWHLGNAYGSKAGQAHEAFAIERLPSELLQPIPLEDVQQDTAR